MSRFLMRMFPVLLLLALALALSDGAAPVVARGSGSISGRVINDLNGDGVQQPGEQGVEGWRVVLTKLFSMNPGSVVVAEARTGPGGDYLFSGVPQGMYEIDLPCNGQPVAQWVGTFLDKRAGRAFYIGPPDAESISGMDFVIGGLAEPLRTDGEITGRVVNDIDMDGTADRREPGLAGWSVSITRESPPLVCLDQLPPSAIKATTDSKGVFRATGLLEGTYWVIDPFSFRPPEDARTRDMHWAATAPLTVFTEPGAVDIPALVPTKVILTSDEMEASVDDTLIALLGGTGSISGALFRDLNGNSTPDENEPPVHPTLTGLLYAKDTALLWVYPIPLGQGLNGTYRFEGLAAGDYVVSASAYVGFLQDRGFRFGPFDVGEGETVADLPFPPLPPEPTPTPRPIPVRPVDVYAPVTGSGSVSSDGSLAGLAAALAVAGALAVGASALPARRRARFRR